MTVVELAALFHDLFDSKYQSVHVSAAPLDVTSWLTTRGVAADQTALIVKIMSNVSYSKEIVRRRDGGWTVWHESCVELHCVMDADKLDALGGFGIARCFAYSGAKNYPLLLPDNDEKYDNCAVAHYAEKLFRLESMMMTDSGRKAAEKRTEIMRRVVQQIMEEDQLLDLNE